MKKIAILIDSLAGGGAECVMLELSRGFIEKNYEIFFILRKRKISHQIDIPIKLFCLEDYKFKEKMRKKDYALILEEILNKNGPFDLILSNLEAMDKIAQYLKHKNLFFIIHNTISKKLENRYKNKGLKGQIKKLKEKIKFKFLYNKKNLITVSNGVKEDILYNLKIKPQTIKVIYNPFDFELIKQKSFEKINFQENNYIINIARFFIEQKRQDILLKAYKKANIKEKLILMGEGPDKNKILNLIKKLNLQNKVIVLDFQKNPYPYLKKAKLFVLSSDYEGLPTVLIEALSLGVKVLSTDCPSGPKEILKELPECLVKPKDIDLLAKKIVELKDSKTLEDKVKNINLTQYSKQYVINQYLNLIER